MQNFDVLGVVFERLTGAVSLISEQLLHLQ